MLLELSAFYIFYSLANGILYLIFPNDESFVSFGQLWEGCLYFEILFPRFLIEDVHSPEFPVYYINKLNDPVRNIISRDGLLLHDLLVLIAG